MPVVEMKVGDLFASGAQTLVNTVNTVGVMGKGIALAFKKRFPEMYEDYRRRCDANQVILGRPYLFRGKSGVNILNFPTKKHWRAVSKLAHIAEGLEYLKIHYEEWGIKSLAVPPLGCGNGQLDWEVVGPTLYKYLDTFDIPVTLYAPHGTPEPQLSFDFLSKGTSADTSDFKPSSRVEPADLVLVAAVSRISRERYHWPVGRVRFQKIAYFLTEVGVPTGLEFERREFGPYCPALKRRTAKLVNNGLLWEEDTSKMIVVSPGPTYKDARNRNIEFLKSWRSQIEKVADLFLRLPATRDVELASSIHFVFKEMSDADNGQEISEDDILDRIRSWKPQFDDACIAEWTRSMNLLEWISAKEGKREVFAKMNEVDW